MQIPKPQSELPRSEENIYKFLAKHKISRRAYDLCPKISDILSRAIGGRHRAIETLKFSQNPDARKLLEFCQRLKWNTQEVIPIEALCLAAGVDVTMIAGALVLAARDVSRMESALITMREHPEIVQATAEFGKANPLASKDREMLHKAVGYLPSPKGSSINLNFGPGVVPDDDDESGDGAPSLDDVFGADPMEIENWGNARSHLLEAPKDGVVIPPSNRSKTSIPRV